MIIVHGKIVDWDLQFFASLSGLLDSQLEELERTAREVPDPDAWGVYDHYEEVCGIGFVACQRYLAAIYGSLAITKPKALALGQRLDCGLTVAQAVNHAANYWKHHDEWHRKKEEKRDANTKQAIEKFGVKVGRDYVLSCVLTGLTHSPTRFKALVSLMEEWREEVRKHA